MLEACLVVIGLFIIFIVVTFFMTRKDYKLQVGDKEFRVKNAGSKLSIHVNESLVVSDQMPQLINGETYEVKYKEEDFIVKCKSNSYGNILRVEIYQDGKLIADNGKTIKEKTKATE